MKTGQSRKVTNFATPPRLAWSPDGKRIAFFDVDGMWRVGPDVGAGCRDRRRDQDSRSAFPAGSAAWSPDGKRIALASVAPLTRRFREGTNRC